MYRQSIIPHIFMTHPLYLRALQFTKLAEELSWQEQEEKEKEEREKRISDAIESEQKELASKKE